MRVLLLLAAIVVWTGCRSSTYYLAKGRELSSRQKYDEAALNYRKAIQKDPQFGEGYYQLGLAELHLNMARDAYQHLSRAVALLGSRDDVKVALADLSFSAYIADRTRPKVLYDQVTHLSDQLLANNPKSSDGLRLKGYLAASDKRLKVAEDFFQRANQVQPVQADMLLMWTEVLFKDNQQAEGERLAHQLIEANKSYGPIYDELFGQYMFLKKSTDAEEILKLKVRNNPNDAETALQLAAFYAGASRESEMHAVLKRMLDDPAAFPRAHLQVGEFYERTRRWDDAVQQYEQGAQASPKEKILYLKRITNIRLAQGKGELALQAVNEIRKQEPSEAEARAVQASLLLASGNPEDVKAAVSLFQDLVKKSPEDTAWRFNLGRALAAQGDAAGAKREFQEAAQRKPNFLSPRLALAHQSQGDGDYQSALRYSTEILAIDPTLPDIRLLRAVSLLNTGNESQARTELLRLQKVFPDEVQLQLAVLDLKQKKFKEAEISFGKLLQKDSGDARAMLGLVQTEVAQNHLEKAVQLLRQELDKSPTSQVVRLLLADVEVARGHLDQAIEQYQRLLRMDPRSAQFHLSLGRAYQQKGDLSRAILELREAGVLAPKDPAPPAMLGHAMIAAGQNREALSSLRHALQLKPDSAALMNDLAFLLVESGGNLDEAAALAEKALQAAPKDPEMADTLAWIYLKQNLNDRALPIFQKLVANHPEEPGFRYHLGMALQRTGDDTGARREFDAALTLHPPTELRRNIETALAQDR